jgi:hypothetical protein
MSGSADKQSPVPTTSTHAVKSQCSPRAAIYEAHFCLLFFLSCSFLVALIERAPPQSVCAGTAVRDP